MILNVAAGSERKPGWVSLDLYSPTADIRHDALQFPYPLEPESVDRVVCKQFIEHVQPDKQTDPLWDLLREFGRILKPGGLAQIETPSATCPLNAWTNPLHRRAFTERSFDFLNGKDESVKGEVGEVPFRLEKVNVERHWHVGRWFNTAYHLPRYLGLKLNVGHVFGLRFILRKPGEGAGTEAWKGHPSTVPEHYFWPHPAEPSRCGVCHGERYKHPVQEQLSWCQRHETYEVQIGAGWYAVQQSRVTH